MNTYLKVADLRSPAVHPLYGQVTILSRWQNCRGQILHRVQLDDDSIRYADLSKGGAQ